MHYGMDVVVNVSSHSLPDTEHPLTAKECSVLDELQRRKHLKRPEPVRDNQGRVVEGRFIEPLEDHERELVEALEARVRRQAYPRVMHCDYKFAPYGEQGCAWAMPPTHSQLLLKKFKQYLRLAGPEAPVPEGVTPLQHGHIPTKYEIMFGHRAEGELMEYPESQRDGYARGQVHKDGRIEDQGAQFIIPGSK